MNSKDAHMKKWTKIIAKAWSDEEFKKRLLHSPEKILEEYGIPTKGKKWKIVENTKETAYLILPFKGGTISSEDLEKISAANYSIQDF